jgi:hypothetical protein
MLTLTNDTITADDFFTGFFATLAAKNYETISRIGQNFDRALADAFDELRRLASENHLRLMFRIRLHPIHGDSISIRDGIAMAVRRDLISLDNPIYQTIRVKLSKDEANEILNNVPGGKTLFSRLVDVFLDKYQAIA